MSTHTLLILTDPTTFQERVEPRLKEMDYILEYSFKKLKDNTLLKVIVDDNTRFRKIKHLMYNLGFYAKRKTNILSKIMLL